MRTLIVAVCGVALAAAVLVLRGPAPEAGKASSHREAPLIAEDPAAGPNWYRFSERARYLIKIDRNGDAKPDVTYRFRFTNREDSLFLGNTVQDYTVTRVLRGADEIVARGVTPPNNIGPRTTPTTPSASGRRRSGRG